MTFACPKCNALLQDNKSHGVISYCCTNHLCTFFNDQSIYSSSVANIPVIIPFGLDLTISDDIIFNSEYQTSKRFSSNSKLDLLNDIRNLILGANSQSLANFRYLSKLVDVNAKVLVVGGGSMSAGLKQFYSATKSLQLHVESIDIYASPYVTCIADAHYLPFESNSFDLVIVQAVLEHVACPSRVITEIYRVINSSGYVYSELPFLQSTHEYPYDFSRVTLIGHDLLYSVFERLQVGSISGPCHSLLFIFSNLVGSLFRARILSIIIRLIFTRIASFIDACLPARVNVEFACGTFFLGRKSLSMRRSFSSVLLNY